MGHLLKLSLRQMASRSRIALILLLALLPVGLTTLISAVAEEGFSNDEFVNHVLDGLFIASILPIVIMVLATSSLGNEVEDRTLNFLVLKPVRRSLIVLPKLLAAVIVGGLVLTASSVAATLLGASDFGVTLLELDNTVKGVLAVGVALFAGSVTYASIFTWAGLMTSRAIAIALVYVFLWEGVISSFLGGVRYLSVRGYTLAILHGMDDKSFASLNDRVIEFPAAIVGAILTTVVFVWLTVRRLRRMDVP